MNIPTTSKAGLLFIISGPAGSGKTTLCDHLVDELSPQVQRVITSTTRTPRKGEENGKDYNFFDRATFEAKIQNNEFIEHAQVHGNDYYGILRSSIEGQLNNNIDLLLNIDVQGAQTFRKLAEAEPAIKNKLITIFILPPSIEELRKRLELRNQDHLDIIEKRLQNATNEIAQYTHFDYCIHSHTKADDFACFSSIYTAEKLRIRKA